MRRIPPVLLSLRLLTSRHTCREIRRMPAWHAERFPLAGFGKSKMFGEKQDLADVVRVVGDLAVDGLHDRMRFRANCNCSREVDLGQWYERIENIFPAAFPHF